MREGMLVLGVLVPLLVIVTGGVVVIMMAMYQRMKTMEMQHRERLAMIERGLAPAPARDPAAFDSWQPPRPQPPARATSIGVVIIALGFGLALIIGLAANEFDVGLGVGGAVVAIGIAFIVNGELRRRTDSRAPGYPPQSYPPPSGHQPPAGYYGSHPPGQPPNDPRGPVGP